MGNVNKEEFFKLVKKADSEYFAKRPCRFCVGNGCDDCRDCKDAEIDHQMWLEVKKLKDEFKEKFGVSYDKECEIIYESRMKEKHKKDALEEVYKRCTIEEIIDYGIKNSKTDKLVSLDEVCNMLYAMLSTQDINDYDYVTAPAYDTVEDLVEDFRKSFEE